MPDAVEMIRAEHGRLRELAASAAEARSAEQRRRSVDQLRTEVCLHAVLSRDLFYPSVAAQLEAVRPSTDAGRTEHERQEAYAAQLHEPDGKDEELHRTVESLIRAIDEHALREEEQLLPRVEAAGQENLMRLGDLMAGRREELVEEIRGGRWDLEELEQHRTTVGDENPPEDRADPSAVPRPPRGSDAARDVGVPGIVAEPEAYQRREGAAGDTV